MRPRRTRTLTALAAGLSLATLLGAAAPAQAETWAGRDARGDAGAFTVDPAPEGDCPTVTEVDTGLEKTVDIVRLAVRHRRDVVDVKVTYDDLFARARTYTNVVLKTPRVDVELSVVGRAAGGYRWVELTTLPDYPDPDSLGDCAVFGVSVSPIACPELSAVGRAAADTLEVSIPRDCLRNPRWVRAAAHTSASRRGTFAYDTWAPAGTDDTGFVGPLGPLGPRVAAAPGADLTDPLTLPAADPGGPVPVPGTRERGWWVDGRALPRP